MTPRKPIRCILCKGRGWYWAPALKAQRQRIRRPKLKAKCYHCDGRGTV